MSERLDKVRIREKHDFDYVTDIDERAQQLIIEAIHEVYPDHQILAEEGEEADLMADDLWIIDPIDGTTNFIHGIPHFAISIANAQKGKIEHAIVYDPSNGELFTASKGGGAKLNNRRIRVSEHTQLKQSVIATGFPVRKPELIDDYLKQFKPILSQSSGVRRQGAAALDLAYVAAGRYDGFWENSLQVWDMAAATLIIKEAGGLVTALDGRDDYLTQGNVLAGNPKIYKQLLKIIHNAK